jgi:hypothetical protein
LLFIFTTLNSFGQDRHIVLQIDTLILNGYDKFSISLTGQGNPNFPTFLNDTVYIKNPIGQPNFICPLTLKTDSSNIRITIDDQGGYLQLIDAYKLKGDTIKINKVFVFENCINDTTFTRIAYYIKKPDGSIGKPFKTKRSKSINKKKCKVKALNKVEYRVNNVSYFALFQEQKDSGLKITEFHGYKPRKYLEDRDNYKGKITYFHGSSTTSRYINVITIKISH